MTAPPNRDPLRERLRAQWVELDYRHCRNRKIPRMREGRTDRRLKYGHRIARSINWLFNNGPLVVRHEHYDSFFLDFDTLI